MKRSIHSKLLLSVLAITLLGFASTSQASSCRPALWLEVKKLADECTAQIESSEECVGIHFSEEQSASFRIGGHDYSAQLLDSPFTDGGDLNDLLIRRDDGCQLLRTAVPAFGNLLEALSL